MADPLKLLKDYLISGKSIKEKNDYLVFGDLAFPRLAKTSYRVYNKRDEYYSLESLYYFYKKRGLAHTAYVKEAAAKNIQIVTRPDRKTLEDYLTKEKLDRLPANIDFSAPVPQAVPVSRLQHELESQTEAKRMRYDVNFAKAEEEQVRKEKERILAILERSSGLSATKTEGISLRDLSKEHGLTADKIATLRSKALARKRTQIKSTEEDLEEQHHYLETVQIDLTKEVVSREQQWRTRTTCMEAQSKNFAKSILPLFQAVKGRDGKMVPGQPYLIGATGDMLKALGRTGQVGYNRYDQERFRKEETEDFKIDTKRTFTTQTIKSLTEDAHGRPLPPHGPRGQPGMVATGLLNKPAKRASRTPIIVIPAVGNSLITMYNAKDILKDLKYVSSDEKKISGTRRENELLIHRLKEGSPSVPYRIVDNPLKLTDEEWDRVVAVFVYGPAWQFKGWPWSGNPAEIFNKVCAFHLKWDDVKLDSNISKWAVNVIALSRTKRHLDRANLLKFWEILDRFIIRNKSYLRY